MRVALAGSKGVPGRHGVEVVVEELGARLAALGHEVTVFAWQGYPGGVTRHRGCVIECTPGPRSGPLGMPIHASQSFRRILGRLESFDLVHIHNVDPALFAGSLPGRIPVVVTSHGRAYLRPENGLFRGMMSRIAERRFLHLGCPATAVSASLAGEYNAMEPGRVVCIPNGLRDLGGRDGRVLRAHGLEEGGYAVFAAGRVIPSKGLHTLLEAWLLAGPPMRLAVAGPLPGGRYGRTLDALASEARAVVTGVLDGQDLGDLFRGARFGIQPSVYEAQSMSLLDMLSCRLPVVYSDIPGNREVAEGFGIPFEPGSVESLAGAIAGAGTVLSRPDPHAWDALGAAHDWNRIADSYLEAYGRAAGSSH